MTKNSLSLTFNERSIFEIEVSKVPLKKSGEIPQMTYVELLTHLSSVRIFNSRAISISYVFCITKQ